MVTDLWTTTEENVSWNNILPIITINSLDVVDTDGDNPKDWPQLGSPEVLNSVEASSNLASSSAYLFL